MPSVWVECFLSLYFDLDLGPVVESCHPPHALTPQGEQSVLHHAFPDCNPDVEHNFIFFFNLEDNNITAAAAHHASCEELQVLSTAAPSLHNVNSSMLYGASYYRQKKDPRVTRGFVQQVFVVISRLPYYNLLETILRVVEPKCAQCCARSPDLTAAQVASPFAPYPSALDHHVGSGHHRRVLSGGGGYGSDGAVSAGEQEKAGKATASPTTSNNSNGGAVKRKASTPATAKALPLLDPSYNPLYYTQQQVLQEAYEEIANHWPTPHPRARYNCWLLREQVQFATPAPLRRRWLPPPTLFSQRPLMDLKESAAFRSDGGEGHCHNSNSVYLIPYHGSGPAGLAGSPLSPPPAPPAPPSSSPALSGSPGPLNTSTNNNNNINMNMSKGREMEILPLYQIFQEQIPYLTRVWELLLHHESLFILSNTPAAASAACLAVTSLISPIRYNGYLKAYFTVQNSDYGRYTRLGALIPFQRHKSTIVAVTNPFFIKHFAGWKHCLAVMDAATIPQPSSSAILIPNNNNNNNNNGEENGGKNSQCGSNSETSAGLLQSPGFSSGPNTAVNSLRSLRGEHTLSPLPPSTFSAAAAALVGTSTSVNTGGGGGGNAITSFLASAASSVGMGGGENSNGATSMSAGGAGASPSSLQKYADFSRLLQNNNASSNTTATTTTTTTTNNNHVTKEKGDNNHNNYNHAANSVTKGEEAKSFEGNTKGFDVDSALLNTKKAYVFQQSSSSSSSSSDNDEGEDRGGNGSNGRRSGKAPSSSQASNRTNPTTPEAREGGYGRSPVVSAAVPPPPRVTTATPTTITVPATTTTATATTDINHNNEKQLHQDPAMRASPSPSPLPPSAAGGVKPNIKVAVNNQNQDNHHNNLENVRLFTAADFALLKTKCKDRTKYYTNQNEELNAEALAASATGSNSKAAAATKTGSGSASGGGLSREVSSGSNTVTTASSVAGAAAAAAPPRPAARSANQQKYKVSTSRAKLQHQMKSYLDTTFTNAYSSTSVSAILGSHTSSGGGTGGASVAEAAAATTTTSKHNTTSTNNTVLSNSSAVAAAAAAAAAAATRQAQHEAASEYFFINHEEQTKLLVKRLEMVSRLGALSQQLAVQQHYDDWFGALQQQQPHQQHPTPPPNTANPQDNNNNNNSQQQQYAREHFTFRCSPDFLFTNYTVADDIVHKYFTSLTLEFLSPITCWYKHVLQHSFKFTPSSHGAQAHANNFTSSLNNSSGSSNKNTPSDYLLVFQLCDKDTVDSLLSPDAFLSFFEQYHRTIAPLLLTKYHPYKTYRYLYEVFARGSLFLSYVFQLVEETLREAFLGFDLTRILAQDAGDRCHEKDKEAEGGGRSGSDGEGEDDGSENDDDDENDNDNNDDRDLGRRASNSLSVQTSSYTTNTTTANSSSGNANMSSASSNAASTNPPQKQKQKIKKKNKKKKKTRRMLAPAETEVIDCFITIYHYTEREVEASLDPDVQLVRAATAVLASLAAALEQPLLREQFMWKIESLKI